MPRRATPSADAVEQLADSLHSAAIHLLRRLRKVDAATGLSPARLSALSVVVCGGPIRVSDLARAEQVKTPTITPIVAALEEAGLIARTADADDARASILSATSRGQKLMAEGRARRVATLTAQLRALKARDRAILEKAAVLLEKIGRDRVL
jgi:DNA-binding MarR family transcriptional regulator